MTEANDTPFFDFTQFQIGETILVTFTVDEATPDTNAPDQSGFFGDPLGTISILGETSGTFLLMSPGSGVLVDVDDEEEFELKSLEDIPSADIPITLDDDVDLNTLGTDVFSDPDDFSTVLAELIALGTFPNASGNSAQVRVFDQNDPSGIGLLGLQFGPAPDGARIIPGDVGAVIPLPAPAALLLTGLVGLAALRRRR
ncbi:MAG: hypothetical protein AAFV62_12055 [Pseudomonadota bacterium]